MEEGREKSVVWGREGRVNDVRMVAESSRIAVRM
ncbi:hypothetical protein BAAA27673_05070 [Bifidobacterium animalis subsp. lactis ATCC 27673]|nr:hypothetical protein BAAA27673_05070 [Bifidobacterium animalis subsp. lactis ATCC 27673]